MSVSEWLNAIMIIIQLFGFRILFAALAVSILVKVLAAARGRLTVYLRSWLWAAALIGLLIPYERSFTILMPDTYVKIVPGFENFFATHASFRFIKFTFLFLITFFPFVWFAGFLFFAVKTIKETKRILRLLRENRISSCVTYFHRWRSHIYLPPDFDTAYTTVERKMLLAHEEQHIAQHDPLIYRLLPTVQCFFWFCPAIHKALRLLQQDRELLCDRRVTDHCSTRAYSHLLLKEGSKKLVSRQVPGIVSESGNMRERLDIFINPVTPRSKTMLTVFLLMTVLFGVGLIGIAPVTRNSLPAQTSSNVVPRTKVSLTDDRSLTFLEIRHIEGMERFVLPQENGVTLDQKGMYDYSISLGMTPTQLLDVTYVTDWRPVLFDSYCLFAETSFTVAELQTETIFMPYDVPFNRLMRVIFKWF